MEVPQASTRRLSTSETLSSGLSTQAALLTEIAVLRSALAHSNLQLDKAHAAGYSNSNSRHGSSLSAATAVSRTRRVSMPASPNATAARTGPSASVLHPHRRNSSIAPSAAHLQAHQNMSRNQQHQQASPSRPDSRSSGGPRSASSLGVGRYPAPSSLATPPATATPPFKLRRDAAYDDLAMVMNAPSPSPMAAAKRSMSIPGRRDVSASGNNVTPAANGLGITTPAAAGRRRSNSLSNSTNSNATPVSASKRPMPVLPRGSVGTATTLAGGGSASPKSPLASTSRSNPSSPSAGVDKENVNPFTNGSPRDPPLSARSEGDIQSKAQFQDPNLPLPPLPPSYPNHLSPELRSPHSTSDGEYSPTATMVDPSDENQQLAVRRGSKSSAGMSRGGSSPFFGGSAGFTERHAARIASSQSGTSKVIMSLQTDLTNSRAQLESTRTQLRASARAVESLTRQIEDLKEGKERSRLELQSMSTTLSRRERMLEETLARARAAEGANKVLEDEKKAHYSECARRTKELEARVREAEERRAKADSEYQAIKAASAGLSDGFRREMKMLKKEMKSLRLKSEQDRNDARTRQQSVTKLISAKTTANEDVSIAMQDLSTWQDAMQKQYQSVIDNLSRANEKATSENEALTKRTMDVLDELRQYKNAMRAYDDKLRRSQS